MQSGKRWISADWWLALSARTIVAIGSAILLLVLIATLTFNVGPVLLLGMALAGVGLVILNLTTQHRGSGSEP